MLARELVVHVSGFLHDVIIQAAQPLRHLLVLVQDGWPVGGGGTRVRTLPASQDLAPILTQRARNKTLYSPPLPAPNIVEFDQRRPFRVSLFVKLLCIFKAFEITK